MVLERSTARQPWVEGYLAYRLGKSRRLCPYLSGSDTAELWHAGWSLAFAHDAGPLSEHEHHWRHVLDKHIPDLDAWPSRGWKPSPR